MKVYILHEFNYENSENLGVYTEEAMRAELENFTRLGHAMNNEGISQEEAKIAKLETEKEAVTRQEWSIMDQIDSETDEETLMELKRARRRVQKRIDELSDEIQKYKKVIEKLRSKTDEELLSLYMDTESLSFEEFELKE